MSSRKFKSYESDAAPFFFYIDVIPDLNIKLNPNLEQTSFVNNPIMPIPIRIDNIFNGKPSVLIRPKPIRFPLNEEKDLIINSTKFLKFGLQKLIYLCDYLSRKEIFKIIPKENVLKWWKLTRHIHGNLHQFEEDFAAFLKSYCYTVMKGKIEETDIYKASLEYCKLVSNICKKRMENNILINNIDGKKVKEEIYEKKIRKHFKNWKRVQTEEFHPNLIDVEMYNISKKEFQKGRNEILKKKKEPMIKKYIPVLIYDDLQECMLQNIKKLEENNIEIYNPSFLLENNIISVINKDQPILNENNDKISPDWWNSFESIDLSLILDKMYIN